jgi:hypothetical protein
MIPRWIQPPSTFALGSLFRDIDVARAAALVLIIVVGRAMSRPMTVFPWQMILLESSAARQLG